MSSNPYVAPTVESLLCVLGRMVSKDTISAEGRLLNNCLWDKPEIYAFGFFLLEKRGSFFLVRKFIEIK
jgi:hypothetical protein